VTWKAYVASVIGSDQQKDAAEKTGVDQSTISRWLRNGEPGRAENIVKFARGYGRPPLQALVAAQLLTATEAKQRPTAAPSLADLTDDELLDEVRRRLHAQHGAQPALRVAARTGQSVGRGRRRQQDEATEAPDPEGPEHGA
jgi:transcriptional regulator with XRE-family HTH domain